MHRDRFCVTVPALTEHFVFVKKIGRGSFSDVHLIRMKAHLSLEYALKCLVRTTHPKRAETELRILRDLGGKNNVMRLFYSFRKDDRIFFFLEYFPHVSFQTFCHDASIDEIRDYMKNLLIALRYIHEHGIIHHDVKPSNFLYDRPRRRYALIDFGLAEEMAPPVFIQLSKTTESSSVAVRGKRKLDFQEDSDSSSSSSKRSEQSQELLLRRSPRKLPSRSFLASDLVRRQCSISTQKQPRLEINGWESNSTSSVASSAYSSLASTDSNDNCQCFGRSQYCKVCFLRNLQAVNQAGTSGFRAPETLMNASSQYQTAAIDVWASGVILLSLLGRRYPFMKPKHGGQALSFIIAIMGTHNVANAAKALGVKLLFNHQCARLDLRELCALFRLRKNTPNRINDDHQRQGSCEKCSSNFRETPTYNGVSFCFCHTGKSDYRGPLFRHCLKTEFGQNEHSSLDDGSNKENGGLMFDRAFDFLVSLLELNPLSRARAADALNHSWFID